MRCRLATILVLLSLWAGPASAGPWARAEGEGFLSFTVGGETDSRAVVYGLPAPIVRRTGVYAEYGLGHGLTLAARIGRSDTAEDAELILRYTLTDPGTTWQFSLEGGAALRAADDRREIRLGASVGRGFGAAEGQHWYWPVAHQGGWATLDLAAYHDLEDARTAWEAEVTLGLSLSDRLNVLFQLKAEDPVEGEAFLTLMPGATWALTDRSTLHLGAQLGGYDHYRVGLSLSLWHSF
jgi:hypothetical protein